MRWTGPLESAALLTILPVPARAGASVRGVLPWAPLIGLVLGGIAAAVAWAGDRGAGPFVGAVLAVGVLAALTRGLHLDGLADTADGLGPLGNRSLPREVMKAGDVGPFGVVALVLTLLLQVACLTRLLGLDAAWAALPAAVVGARVAMARAGLPGVPAMEGSSLGRAVSGTVSLPWLAGVSLLVLLLAGALPLTLGQSGSARAVGSMIAVALGWLAAEVLFRRARHRLGGVNGDVIGAMGEVATTVTLLGAAFALG